MRIFWLFFLVLFLAGCSSGNKSLEESVFFDEVFPLSLFSSAENEYQYFSPRLDFSKYRQVYVAPVKIFGDEDGGVQLNRLVTGQIKENLRFRLEQSFEQKGWELVDEPVTGGIEVHAALTSIRIAEGGFHFSDFLLPDFSNEMELDAPGSRNQRSLQVRGEAFVRDTRAGLTVGQFVSIKQGTTAADHSSTVTYNEVRPLVEHWAERAGWWVASFLKNK